MSFIKRIPRQGFSHTQLAWLQLDALQSAMRSRDWENAMWYLNHMQISLQEVLNEHEEQDPTEVETLD